MKHWYVLILLIGISLLMTPVTAASVPPTLVSGNPECPEGYFGFKVDPPNSGVYVVDSVGNITVDVYGGGKYFNWTSTFGIDQVIAKGGPNANVYPYNPESYGDTNLSAPTNPITCEPYGLSYIWFCYLPKLIVTKTAETSYNRTCDWDINKTVDKDSWDLFTGDSGESEFALVPEVECQDSDFKVTGQIKIYNPADLPAKIVSVTDVVSPNLDATVDCPESFPYLLPSNGWLNCTYSRILPDNATRSNNATVTTCPACGAGVGNIKGNSGYADVIFGDPTNIIHECVFLDDTNEEFEDPVELCYDDAPFDSISYNVTYTCDGDEGRHDNIANITDADTEDLLDSDDESVTVDCYSPVVIKDAQTTFNRTYIWNVTKTADENSIHFPTPDAPNATVNYTVTAFVERFTDSGYTVRGTITVTNPNPSSPMGVSVEDVVSPNIVASLDCGGTLNIPADDSATCNYTAALPDNSTRLNTANVTFNAITYSGTAPVTFSDTPTEEIDECVDIYDDKTGPDYIKLGEACEGQSPKQFKYTLEYSPDMVECEPDSFPNTANLTTKDLKLSYFDYWTVDVTETCGIGQLCVFKFNDTNMDGEFDDGEEDLLDGWEIKLWINTTGGDTPDFVVANGTTGEDGNGQVCFETYEECPPPCGYECDVGEPLLPGKYWVSEDIQGGWYPTNSTIVGPYGIIALGEVGVSEDPEIFFGNFFPEPCIEVEKYVWDGDEWQDADSETGPFIADIGGNVTWKINVTNCGNVNLNLVWTDWYNNTAINLANFKTSGSIPSMLVANGGTVEFELGTPWFKGQQNNTVCVNGMNSTTGAWDDDCDPAYYFGAEPCLNVTKYVWDGESWDDANAMTGPYLSSVENPVHWLVEVENCGNVDFDELSWSDFYNSTDVTSLIDPWLLAFGDALPTSLDAGENDSFRLNTSWFASQQNNTVCVEGTNTTDGFDDDDCDPAHYFGSNPSLSIVKKTNGQDNNCTQEIPVGDPVTWTYNVTNTGNVPLTNVIITDNKTGYVCTIPELAPEASAQCQKPGIATEGAYHNLGTAEGQPPAGSNVTANEPDCYVGILQGTEWCGLTQGFWKENIDKYRSGWTNGRQVCDEFFEIVNPGAVCDAITTDNTQCNCTGASNCSTWGCLYEKFNKKDTARDRALLQMIAMNLTMRYHVLDSGEFYINCSELSCNSQLGTLCNGGGIVSINDVWAFIVDCYTSGSGSCNDVYKAQALADCINNYNDGQCSPDVDFANCDPGSFNGLQNCAGTKNPKIRI